jgi:DNA-directed RNA polymerase subunit RPC12/RpoP
LRENLFQTLLFSKNQICSGQKGMKLSCVHCGNDFAITSDQLGGRGRCPHCEKIVEFPRGSGQDDTEFRSRPISWMDNSISGLGSIAIHLILMILIAIVPWSGGSDGVGETYEVMIGVADSESLVTEEQEQLEQESPAESTEAFEDPLLNELPTEDSSNDTLVQIDSASLSPSATNFSENALKSSSASGGGQDFNGLIKQLKRDGLDIVITFDSTGSMGGEIGVVKNKIQRIGTTLMKLIPKTRISICTYRDQSDAYVVKGTPLTSNLNDVMSFLDGVDAAGGGDQPEAVVEGLKWSLEKNSFRRRARKIILLFGDYPPHEIDQSQCLELATNFRYQENGVISCVTCRRPSQMPEFNEIAKAGGGESFLTGNDREIMTQLVVLVFGNKHRKKVIEAFKLFER